MINPVRRKSSSELLAEIEHLTWELTTRTNRDAEYADLAGESSREVYRHNRASLGRIAMTACRELKSLEGHRHEWGFNDYCNVCGADGRA